MTHWRHRFPAPLPTSQKDGAEAVGGAAGNNLGGESMNEKPGIYRTYRELGLAMARVAFLICIAYLVIFCIVATAAGIIKAVV